MPDVLDFINGNQGALLLVLICINIWTARDLHNLKGWVSSLDREVRGKNNAKENA